VTLIAARVERGFAELLTDELAYGAQLVELGSASKVRHYPHADAAMLARGDGRISSTWAYHLDQADPDFDQWDELAQDQLPTLWQQLPAPPTDRARAFSVFEQQWILQVGYSASQGRVIGFEYRSDDGFQSHPIDGLLSRPAPPVDTPVVPCTDAQWARYADDLFDHVALTPIDEGRDVFGGRLFLTRLERGSATTRQIGEISVDSARFRKALHGTAHPVGQLGPCPCGSGGPFAICCPHRLNPLEPCLCGSGELFGDCHWVSPVSIEAFTHWAGEPEGFAGPLDLEFLLERAVQIVEHWTATATAACSAPAQGCG
jgi:hypothetical protein